jgi:putative hydrolase of the HAD superfamily
MQLKNIIFDLGGVIINIDYNKAASAFKNLGIVDFDNFYSKAKQSTLFDEFEKGNISNEEFRNKLRSFLPEGISDAQIDACWNAMLLDIPQERFDFLNLILNK